MGCFFLPKISIENEFRGKTQINVCISKTEQEKNNWNFLVKRWRKREKRIRSWTTAYLRLKKMRERKVILRKPKEWRMQFANGKLRYKLQECFFFLKAINEIEWNAPHSKYMIFIFQDSPRNNTNSNQFSFHLCICQKKEKHTNTRTRTAFNWTQQFRWL